MTFDIKKIRADFPILSREVNKKPLIYLDNGATTQKPQVVIDKIVDIYTNYNSNIHRGVHYLSSYTSEAYENSRKTVQSFINAKYSHEVIFTSGTTGSINTLADSLCQDYIKPDDEVIISELEHHANIVSWQVQFGGKGVKLKVLPINDAGELLIEKLPELISEKTKLISITQVSNTLGTVNPVKEIIKIAHQYNIPVLIDGAQAVQHTKVDVQDLDCDFYVFSGHKIYAPTGIGVLYGKEKWLDKLPPCQGGGDMILSGSVSFEKTLYQRLPFKFEAGTTNYVGAIAMATALEYVQGIGIENIENYEKQLLEYANKKLSSISELIIYGNAKNKACVISFLIDTVHHYDTGMILDKLGIAVRTGTHCTEPLMKRLRIDGTVRASMAFYNTFEEIDVLCSGIERVKTMFF
ncbi:MAG: cysteine sulfinate desulfinase [Bacteroidetes bacterium GWA2_31_9]|nr:MAG: cysteine sulfinate desulfinase [Bacteroidetes bacterium GWA2_31_9]